MAPLDAFASRIYDYQTIVLPTERSEWPRSADEECAPSPTNMPSVTTVKLECYLISCSNLSNSSAVKNSDKETSRPSQNFLMVTMEMSLRVGSIMLYAVDGVTPER